MLPVITEEELVQLKWLAKSDKFTSSTGGLAKLSVSEISIVRTFGPIETRGRRKLSILVLVVRSGRSSAVSYVLRQ